MATVSSDSTRNPAAATKTLSSLSVEAAKKVLPNGAAGTSAAPVTWSWKPVLEKCREVAQARSIVALDAEGSVVAWSGNLDEVDAARLAAHVGKAFDLLDRLKFAGRFAECVCAEYEPEGTWLTAVRVAPRLTSVVTIAVLGPYTFVHRGRELLRTTFVRLLEATRIP
jgi:hypothetical protein